MAGSGNERAVDMSRQLATQTVNRNLDVFKHTGHMFEKVNHGINAMGKAEKSVFPVPVKFETIRNKINVLS